MPVLFGSFLFHRVAWVFLPTLWNHFLSPSSGLKSVARGSVWFIGHIVTTRFTPGRSPSPCLLCISEAPPVCIGCSAKSVPYFRMLFYESFCVKKNGI
jgi:hypothetical protein